MPIVRIIRMGESNNPDPIEVPDGTRVADLLEMKNISAEGYGVNLDGVAATLDSELSGGPEAESIVALVPKVTGGNHLI